MLYNVSGFKRKTSITEVEFSGFIAWLITTIGAMLFTVWAFVPENVINEHFKIYPHFLDRFYILALGNWLGVLFCVYNISIHCISVIKSHPRESYKTMVDKYTDLGNPPQPSGDCT